MKKTYYLYNWSETKQILLGDFTNSENAWKFYWENLDQIKVKQNTLEPNGMWFMDN